MLGANRQDCSRGTELTGNAFIVAVLPEYTERRCETAFPIRTFLVFVVELRGPLGSLVSVSRMSEQVKGLSEEGTHCGKAGIFTLASTSGMPGSRGAKVDGLLAASPFPLSA